MCDPVTTTVAAADAAGSAVKKLLVPNLPQPPKFPKPPQAARAPDPAVFRRQNQAGIGTSSSTMLTGSGGIDASTLNLGRNSMLGL